MKREGDRGGGKGRESEKEEGGEERRGKEKIVSQNKKFLCTV